MLVILLDGIFEEHHLGFRYVLDGFPMTLKQAELMGSRSITPMIVVELELDTVEVLKRNLADKMNPKRSEHLQHSDLLIIIVYAFKTYTTKMLFHCRFNLMQNSAEILHIRSSCYKQEIQHVRQYFQQRYHNWIQFNGLKSKWWIWDSILTEVSISMKYICSYLERTRRGKLTDSTHQSEGTRVSSPSTCV